MMIIMGSVEWVHIAFVASQLVILGLAIYCAELKIIGKSIVNESIYYVKVFKIGQWHFEVCVSRIAQIYRWMLHQERALVQ